MEYLLFHEVTPISELLREQHIALGAGYFAIMRCWSKRWLRSPDQPGIGDARTDKFTVTCALLSERRRIRCRHECTIREPTTVVTRNPSQAIVRLWRNEGWVSDT